MLIYDQIDIIQNIQMSPIPRNKLFVNFFAVSYSKPALIWQQWLPYTYLRGLYKINSFSQLAIWMLCQLRLKKNIWCDLSKDDLGPKISQTKIF